MTWALLVLFEAARFALRGMLVVLTVHLVRAAVRAMRRGDPEPPKAPAEWPRVTVQLPLRNEYYVAERILRAAARLDYPRDRLELQVLDDSDDETRARVDELASEIEDEGVTVRVVRRPAPEGYKAGALQAGLVTATGELIAIFDADCVPAPDFLRRIVPYFQDPRAGCVQVRWSFLNRTQSLLTRVQAIVLDGLFAVDQFARATSGLPLQFNGTNGVWRAEAIRDAGGWRGEILAEDADLSFRAHLVGWRLVHVRDYAVPTELPSEMGAFRTQQQRWSRGSAQLLRDLGWRIARSDLPLRDKVMMWLHMGRHAIDPLIVLACLTSPLTTLFGLPYLVDYSVPLNAALLGSVGLGCVLFYAVALRYVGATPRDVLAIPLVIPLAIGLSLAYTLAFAQGLLQRGGSFVRTPKAGAGGGRERGPRYATARSWLALFELALAAAHAASTVECVRRGLIAEGLFFAMVALGLGWVAAGTLASRGVGERA